MFILLLIKNYDNKETDDFNMLRGSISGVKHYCNSVDDDDDWLRHQSEQLLEFIFRNEWYHLKKLQICPIFTKRWDKI